MDSLALVTRSLSQLSSENDCGRQAVFTYRAFLRGIGHKNTSKIKTMILTVDDYPRFVYLRVFKETMQQYMSGFEYLIIGKFMLFYYIKLTALEVLSGHRRRSSLLELRMANSHFY